METLVTCPVTVQHWETQLLDLVERHARETGSRKAARQTRATTPFMDSAEGRSPWPSTGRSKAPPETMTLPPSS